MPYNNVEELPESIQNSLPEHAQEIYLAAFNNAWQQYTDPEKRRGKASLEEVAHRVAWAAVKKEYRKDRETGEWRKK
ncbi:MAG: ChaB family protein [Chloroflexota bacterium]